MPDIDNDVRDSIKQMIDAEDAYLPRQLGIDHVTPGCKVLNVDTYGVGTGVVPRWITVRLNEYATPVFYRGGISGLAVDDKVNVIRMSEGNLYEVVGAGGSTGTSNHNLLSATHGDTVASTMTRGDMVVGTAAGWDDLAIGTAHQLLKVNAGGTDPAWTSPDWDDFVAAAGADMVHDHVSDAEGGNKLGDAGGGHYTEIESDGTLHFIGNATVWDDLRVSGLAMKLGASAPDFGAILASGGLYAYLFDGVNTTEQVFFMCQLPHSYKEGTDIYAHVHWMPTTNDAGTVVWQLEGCWVNVDAVGAVAAAFDLQDAAAGAAWTHQMTPTIAIDGDPGAVNHTISSMFIGRLFRDPTDGDDNYEHDAVLLEFDLHFQIDTVGSRGETTK